MKRGLSIIVAMLALAVSTRAQIEKQAATYELTLDECLAQTLDRFPEIQRLRADVERAAGDKLVFRSRALPQLTAHVRAGVDGGSLYSSSDFFSELSGAASQPLVDVGIPATLRRGKLEVVIAQQNLNREVTDRLHEARITFLQALYLRDLVALYEEIGARLQANVDGEQQRLDAGTAGKAPLVAAKIQKLNLDRDLADLRNGYFAAVTRLSELTGRDPSEKGTVRLPKPVGSLTYTPVKVDWRAETSAALTNRADLKLLRAVADAAAEDKRATQAGYYPFVSLVASGLFIPEDILFGKPKEVVPGRETRTTEFRGGMAMTWRVIDNGQVTGAARRIEATRESYAIALRKLEQSVPRELAVIRSNLEGTDARLTALRKSEDDAGENLKLIEARVSLGEATQLDFLKSQGNLLSVRAGIVDAIHNCEMARAELDRATGRYLQFHASAAP